MKGINIKNKGIQVVFAAAILNFLTGVIYTWSIISKFLIEHLNWTGKQASISYTIYSLVFSISMVVYGKLQDKYGPQLLSTIGGIFVGFGFVLSSVFVHPLGFIITIGILVGMGVGTVSASTTAPALKWFPSHMKGRITGFVIAGVGLSSVFFSPVVEIIINTYSLSKTFLIIGVFILVSTVFFSRLLINPPLGYNPEGHNGSEKSESYQNEVRNLEWNDMLKTLDFYKLWIMLACSSAAGLMAISHISNISKVQIGFEGGFILVILISVFSTLGRLVGGSLSDILGRIRLMRIVFIVQGINMLLFSNYNNLFYISLGACITGFSYGAVFPIFPAITSDYYGLKNFGMNYGILFTGWGLGGFLGPMIAATIYDNTNSYRLAFILAFFLLLFSTIITFRFKKES